jgi:phage host-nuclease inhibitor protein Gam
MEECTSAMGGLLDVTVQLEGLVAERDASVAKASAIYETSIDTARSRKAGIEAALEAYYYGHLAELETAGKKSAQLVNGVMGRRDNPAKLVLRNKAWSWGSVLVALRAKFGDRFVRTPPPEIDKEAVKAEIPEEGLADVGLRLAQDETFYALPARLPALRVVRLGAEENRV